MTLTIGQVAKAADVNNGRDVSGDAATADAASCRAAGAPSTKAILHALAVQ